MQSSSNHHVCFQPNATNDDGIDESPSARSRSSPPEVSSLTSPTTTTTHPPSTHMSPSYAAATSAWQPQSADEQPHPDPALLVSPSSSSDKSGIEGITITSKSTTELTPPMTPSSERSESIGRAAVDGDEAEDGSEGGLRQRKHKGESKEKGGKEKKVPGAGFLQSLPGDVTEQRPMREDLGEKLDQPWIARANIAASVEKPDGTTDGGYAEKNKDAPVLKQHVLFFDKDADNIIWPLDTWRGFRELGYSFFWCCFAMSVIHFFFSWFSAPGILPDPFFRIFLKNGHRTKHGSDTGVYDPEGRFIPAKFEEIFTKFDKNGKGGLSFKEGLHMIHANRQAADPIGWCAEGFEWASTYLLIWPQDGICDKESIRTVYDGSLFYVVAAAERQRSLDLKLARQRMTLPQLAWSYVPGVWQGWKKENRAGNFKFGEEAFEMIGKAGRTKTTKE